VVPAEVVVTPETLAAVGAVEAYGWFVIGALLLIVGVFGVVTFVIALREARGRRRLEAVDAAQVHHEVRACAEPETKRTGSEGDPTW
jgi:heme/copper-type cytochrome/quinol oxidase subunit 2